MNKKIAQKLYFNIQKLRKEPVLRRLNEIRTTQWLAHEELVEKQLCKLKKIIEYAYNNVSFYKEKYQMSGVHPDDLKTIDDIEKFPIITREDIQRNIEKMYGSKRPNSVAKTSGTTGQSLKLYIDNNSWAYHHANIFRTFSWYGIEPREPELRIWGRRIDGKAKRETILKDLIFNRLRINAFNIEKDIRKNKNRIKNFNPSYIYGYASSICQFIDEFIKNYPDKLKIKMIACTAEYLTQSQENILKRAFNLPVTDIYGAAEVGIISSRCPAGNRHIPIESIVVNIENKEKVPGNENEIGDVIVTDLNNYSMPIIRYEIGDRAYIKDKKCDCKRGLPLLSQVKGRKLEYIVGPEGRRINSVFVYYLFKGLESIQKDVRQYQLIQEKRDYYKIKIISKNAIREKSKKYLESTLKKYIANDIVVKVYAVKSIEPGKSGKQQIYKTKIKRHNTSTS
jgi:phenylacetate-CoA ligase